MLPLLLINNIIKINCNTPPQGVNGFKQIAIIHSGILAAPRPRNIDSPIIEAPGIIPAVTAAVKTAMQVTGPVDVWPQHKTKHNKTNFLIFFIYPPWIKTLLEK
jgi:hypothetical protein